MADSTNRGQFQVPWLYRGYHPYNTVLGKMYHCIHQYRTNRLVLNKILRIEQYKKIIIIRDLSLAWMSLVITS